MKRFVLKLSDSEIRLAEGHWRLGRDAACEIRLNDESVSRRHASLRVEADTVELTDQGSRNGIRVNGERMHGRLKLHVGDRIQIGIFELELTELGLDQSIPGATKPMPKVPKTGSDSLVLLSRREREVFERLAKGQTQRVVAEELGLSVKTVETYRARIKDKLGLQTRADLVALALKTGVLRPSS